MIDILRRAGIPLAEIGAFLHHPSEEQLQMWTIRVQRRASCSQGALSSVRQLLAMGEGSVEIEEGAPMPRLRAVSRSEQGLVRHENQDALLSNAHLVVVADGMGGAPGGGLASSMAVAITDAAFAMGSIDELGAGIRAANRAIWERARTEAGLEGMGTTLCAAGLLRDGALVVAHVGDSRAYLFHGQSLFQMTDDHTVTAELVRRGELNGDDARRHPHHGVLTRALGVGPEVVVDSSSCTVETADRVLLCTDGVSNEISAEEIRRVLGGSQDIESAAHQLVDLVISRAGRDDASVIVAEVSP